jgi:hypothetical protein
MNTSVLVLKALFGKKNLVYFFKKKDFVSKKITAKSYSLLTQSRTVMYCIKFQNVTPSFFEILDNLF